MDKSGDNWRQVLRLEKWRKMSGDDEIILEIVEC